MAKQHLLLGQETLSIQDHAVRICHRLAGYDFPWDLTRSLELAVLKTFCAPRISRLLRETGEFTQRPQKRYDDTTLILGNVLKWGYDSPQGKTAIARMNRIHKRFDILNEDFLYVLSTAIYEPVHWNQRFGWRPFTEVEKQALFNFWRVVGQRMEIQDIPSSYERFEQFNRAYEAKYFHYHADNAAVGNAVIKLMQSWFPAIAAPLVPLAVKAVADEPMCKALGWNKPNPAINRSLLGGFRLSRKLARCLPHRQQTQFIVDRQTVTYPNGYEIHKLGPEGTEAAPSTSRCPFLKMRSFLKADF